MHIDDLRMILKDETPAFVVISETWLDNTVHNIEVDIGGYKVERLDHNRFLDLQKAFAVVDHSLLLQKLKANGISGAEHAWFRSYLTNRKQFVQCNRVNSNERTVTHGVPQWSVLGPTLFCIHISVNNTRELHVSLHWRHWNLSFESYPQNGSSQNKF